MDLTYDWKKFQTLFIGHDFEQSSKDASKRLFFVLDGTIVVAADGDGENLEDWIGSTQDEIVAEFGHREMVTYQRKKIEEFVQLSTTENHYYEQIEFVKRHIAPAKRSPLGQGHFLLNAMQGGLRKFLPTKYALYFQIENGPRLVVGVQDGKVIFFHEPDLTSLMIEKRKRPPEIVRHLSSHYRIPVLGLFTTAAEWKEWSSATHPWAKITSSLRKSRDKVVPLTLGIRLLLFSRRWSS